MPDIVAINAYLQSALARKRLNSVAAVTAAEWLDADGLLLDSPSRPGKPLRNLLRSGRILGQRQALNGRWTIEQVQARPAAATALPSPTAPVALTAEPVRPLSGRQTGVVMLKSVGLQIAGQTTWDRPNSAPYPGVYIVDWPRSADVAPIDEAAVASWIQRVPSLRLDGARPTASQLVERLERFWLPDQTVVYVGLTSSAISKRLRAYARTPLGDARPHAGGHWLKTLEGYESCLVTWAFTEQFAEMERLLVAAFAAMATPRDRAGLWDVGTILPYANLTVPSGPRKNHGISGSSLR